MTGRRETNEEGKPRDLILYRQVEEAHTHPGLILSLSHVVLPHQWCQDMQSQARPHVVGMLCALFTTRCYWRLFTTLWDYSFGRLLQNKKLRDPNSWITTPLGSGFHSTWINATGQITSECEIAPKNVLRHFGGALSKGMWATAWKLFLLGGWRGGGCLTFSALIIREPLKL